MKTMTAFAAHFYARFHIAISLLSFVAGFALSFWRQDPIDTDWSLAGQAVTLAAVFSLLLIELIWRSGAWKPQGLASNVWRWHELIQHFLLGGLLRGYAVFFMKSAGMNGSLIFLALLTLILLANELPFVQNRGTLVRTALWSLALSCFLTYLIPRITHNLGPSIFSLSVGVCALLVVVAWLAMRKRVTPDLRKKFFLYPALATLAGYLALYHLALIPPVPLMLARFEVVHLVEKNGKDWWLMKSPEKNFMLRPGDRAVAAFKLVAPPRFVEELRVRWQWKTTQGWQETDSISVKIHGGRKEGFRGTTDKSHLWPGEWRVLLETEKGREISRLRFKIIKDEATHKRSWILDLF